MPTSFDRLATPVAVLVGALLITLAIGFHASTSRYQLAPLGGVVMIDTRTGETKACQPTRSPDYRSYILTCGPDAKP